ncbi:MAG: L,D-transpeptidase family protein [Actinomycetota bacterium]|nr:L,D-transpeptidase family protein [Actinomycetota bacterium]
MKTTTLRRKVPALFLALFLVQLTAASAASAAPAVSSSALQAEQRLAALHYDVGPVDGVVDARSSNAVIAFQKVNGLPRTGQLTDAVATQILATTASPAPLVPGGGASRVEVDLARQVLFLYEGNALSAILPVSTGKASTPTPRGSFHFYRYDPGWTTSRLGQLYNAVYFVGGYAIHGSNSVPAYPASHGCIRIPMSAAQWFPSHVSTATAVYVI